MIVGSRRKQRGALRTHDSAGEAPPQTKHKGEVGGSQNSAPQGAQSGELDQRHTMSFHQCRQGATNCRHISVAPVAQSLTIQSHRADVPSPQVSSLPETGVAATRGAQPPKPPTGAPPQHGVSALPSHASSSRSPTRPPEGVPAGREDQSWGK